MVREQAGLPSPGSVTSLQMLLRPLFTFQKCPSKAATASKAGKTCPGKSGTPENSGDNRGTHTCEPGLSLSAKKQQTKMKC